MDTILKIENVTKSYTGHKALDNVSLEVPRGAVYGLLGPNGAGMYPLQRSLHSRTFISFLLYHLDKLFL